jgi:hypothetical protein
MSALVVGQNSIEKEDFMSLTYATVFAVAIALAGCKHQAHGPLNPAAEQKARADLKESIENYLKTAPKKRDLRAVLNPNMEVLQGDPDDPVPSHVGLLKAVPPSPQSGLDAFSPIIVRAVQRRLRHSLQREPTADEVVNEITTVESKQATDIGNQLESRRAEIAAMYAEIASFNQQGKTDEARKRLADLRALREGTIASWYQQQGIAAGKSDTSVEALSPEQTVTADRDLLLSYLNNGVTDSR